MSKKLCEICLKNLATVPDRNVGGRPINRICRVCHCERIKNDFDRIFAKVEKRRQELEAELNGKE